MFDNDAALLLLPKLVQLLDARILMAKGNEKETNLYNFRKAVVLQDMAQLKIAIRKPYDSFFHLQEAEKLIRGVRVDDEVSITEIILKAAQARNFDLDQKAKDLKLK